MHVVLSPDPKVVASYFNALIQFTFAVWKILIIFVIEMIGGSLILFYFCENLGANSDIGFVRTMLGLFLYKKAVCLVNGNGLS
ncbi:hypothetical protein SDJN02_04422, partial [Cucurbita argyrosperma subsp. argyrosperma]